VSAANHSAAAIARALSPRPVRTSSGWLVCCLTHPDRDPSLHLSDGDDGRLLVRCFAGCDQQQVIEALKQRGLWARRTAPSRRHAPQPAPAKERKTTAPWAVSDLGRDNRAGQHSHRLLSAGTRRPLRDPAEYPPSPGTALSARGGGAGLLSGHGRRCIT
jgi:hypothetical protein